MGRRGGSSGPKAKKRKKVTVQLLKRVNAGQVVEPYKILEEIVAKDRADLADVKLALAWRVGWRPDANNILTLGRCRKRGDLDRELDGFDVVILLNKEAWAALKPKEKQALIFHELCHAQVVYDSDGEPKRDDLGRQVMRIRKHDIEEFRAVVERFGTWTQDLAAIAQAGINDSKRPLLAEAEKADGQANGAASSTPAAAKAPGDPDVDLSWRKLSLAAAAFKANHLDALEAAGMRCLGDLQDAMNKHGGFWPKDTGVSGRFKESIEDCFNAYLRGLQKAAARAAAEAEKAAKAVAAKAGKAGKATAAK